MYKYLTKSQIMTNGVKVIFTTILKMRNACADSFDLL